MKSNVRKKKTKTLFFFWTCILFTRHKLVILTNDDSVSTSGCSLNKLSLIFSYGIYIRSEKEIKHNVIDVYNTMCALSHISES